MPTLNARFVRRSKKVFWCDNCDRIIKNGTPYIRLYGMADVSEKPWTLRFHFHCINSPHITEEALRMALNEAQRYLDAASKDVAV